MNFVIVLDSMSPIYTFFFSAGIKENHRVDITGMRSIMIKTIQR